MKLLRPVFAIFAAALTLTLAACGSDLTAPAPAAEEAVRLEGQVIGSGH